MCLTKPLFAPDGAKKTFQHPLISCSANVTRVCLCLVLFGYPLLALARISEDEVQQHRAQTDPSQPSSDRQSTGTITGTVEDQSGAVSVGVEVKLGRDGQSDEQEVLTGTNGQFSFSRVPPGPFRLTVGAQDFNTQEVSGELHPGEFQIVPLIVLGVSGGTTEVNVALTPVEVAQAQIKEAEKQRIFGIIPNYYASYDSDPVPLNSRQKFELAWKTAIDPVTFLGAGVYAGFEQAGDRYPGYGQGAEGYVKRYFAGYGNAVSGIFIGNAILPSLLKQDPRYFYKGTGTKKSRILYALASSVMCKGDNGQWQPNYSFIGGSIAAGGISDLTLPASDRNGAGTVFQNALIRIGQGSLGGLLQEFLLRKVTPHAHNQQ